MTTGAASKARTMIFWVLRVFLGVIFLAIGTSKLTGTLGTVPYFDRIGWGQWFRYLTGVLDVTGAVLLFVPRRTFYGAVMITCVVGTAAMLAVLKPGLPLVAPLIFALLAATLAWLARPRGLE